MASQAQTNASNMLAKAIKDLQERSSNIHHPSSISLFYRIVVHSGPVVKN